MPAPTPRQMQTASEGTPLDVEFRAGRLPPELEECATQFARAYEAANLDPEAIPGVHWLDTLQEHPVFDVKEWQRDGDSERFVLQGYNVESPYPSMEGVPMIGMDLVVALCPGVPVSAVDTTPAPERLVGVEVRVRAAQVCRAVKHRCGHLYRPLVDAAVFANTMTEIGLRHGGNKLDAAKIGRAKVHDALLFAKAAFEDLMRREAGRPANDNHRALRDIA